MDEAYSLGLANYDKVEIEDNEDFYDNWHKGEYYEDYLTVNSDESGQYKQVYVNQKNDVHPPFYYLLLRLAMTFTVGHFSVWPGIVINVIVYLFITLFLYAIVKRIFNGHKHQKQKAAALAFLASVTMGSITTAIYIRMYALTSLMILMIAYLHIKLKEEPEKKIKWFLTAHRRHSFSVLRITKKSSRKISSFTTQSWNIWKVSRPTRPI